MSIYMFVSQLMGLNLHIFSSATIMPSGIDHSRVNPNIFSVGGIYSSMSLNRFPICSFVIIIPPLPY